MICSRGMLCYGSPQQTFDVVDPRHGCHWHKYRHPKNNRGGGTPIFEWEPLHNGARLVSDTLWLARATALIYSPQTWNIDSARMCQQLVATAPAHIDSDIHLSV